MSVPETQAHHHPALGEPGEQCVHCGAVLAPDQRYCVNCGLRRADPRVEYRELLSPNGGASSAAPPAVAASSPATAAPAAPAGTPGTRTVSPLGAAVAIGLLLLATLLGAVLGRGSDTGNQRPVIVGAPAATGTTVAGAPGATAGGTVPEAAVAGAAAGAAAESKRGSTSTSGSSNSGATDAAPKTSAPAPSTQDYVKKSKKLPDKVGTGGAPPPKDDAAPGGGSEGTTIG